jgi:hypothetical protein
MWLQNEKSDWFLHAPWWKLIRRKMMTVFIVSYRPERHYMRGPGPKWREKHGRPLAR